MDVNRLRFGEMVAAAGAAVLFLVMFLDWYGAEDGPGGLSAWQSFTFIDLFLFFLVIIPAIALAVLTTMQRTVALPLSVSVLVTALGSLASLLILYRLVNEPSFDASVADRVVDIKIWAWLGLLSALTIAFGGFMSMRDEGTSFGSAGRVQPPMRPAPPPGPGAPSPPPTGMPPPGEPPGAPAPPPQGAPPGQPPGAPPGPPPGVPPGPPPGVPPGPPPGAPPGPPPGAPPGQPPGGPPPGHPPGAPPVSR